MRTFLLSSILFFSLAATAQRLPFGLDGGKISPWSFPVTQVFFVTDLGPVYPPPHTLVDRAVYFPQRAFFTPQQQLPYQFRRPEGAVFCRMEDYTARKVRVMFSLHAGGYSER